MVEIWINGRWQEVNVSHLALTEIGVNSHADIDAAIVDAIEHYNDTETAHGATGEVVGATNAQTISNKIFDDSNKYGGEADYTEFETDGTMVARGAATTWNDVNISLVPPAGQSSALPAVIAINGDAYLDCYAFSGTNSTPDEIHGSIEVLHDYKEGSDIVFHVHWAPTTAAIGNVKWQLRFAWFNPLGIPAGVTQTVVDTTSGIAWQEQNSSFIISGVGKTMGSRFIFCLFRDPVDALDTYAANVAAYDMGIHYEKDTLGSRQITTK